MNCEFAIQDSLIFHELQDCFEQIASSLKNNPALVKYEAPSFSPEGTESLQVGTKITACGISLHIDLLYPHRKNLDRYAIREKIHLHPEGLEIVSSMITERSFRFLNHFFDQSQKKMSLFEENSYTKKVLSNYTFQLLLIKYSQSTPTYDSTLHEFGSRIFGNIHEDDTLYSFHFGETQPEIEFFDYKKQNWKKPDWTNNSIQVFYGDHSRSLDLIPTSHRLVANLQCKEATRYSFIMERNPKKNSLPITEIFRPELIRFASAKIREQQTAFLIWDEYANGEKADEETLKLTEDFIKLHLFFFIRGDESKIHRYRRDFSFLEELEKKNYCYIVCLRPGFLIKCEHSVETLISGALQQPEKYFIHHYHQRLRAGMCLAVLGSKKAEGLDQYLKKMNLHDTSHELPHYIIPESKDHFFSHMLSNDLHSKSDEILHQRKKINRHLSEGFSTTFVFNTEGYEKTSGLHFAQDPIQLIGFASGFKMNYIASLYKKNIKKISFVDSNLNSIELKRKMLADWNGEDFPRWFFKNWKNNFAIYEKDPLFFQKRWEHELTLWGGADLFQENWRWFQSQDITFHHFDVLQQAHQFSGVFDKSQAILFWASNLWHNEYVSFHFGASNLKNAYLLWLQTLRQVHSNIFFIQDELPTPHGWIDPNQKNINHLLKDLR